MSNFYSSQIDQIVADTALSKEEKIERLLVIESQARDLQRAASSSAPDNSGDTDDDVAKVELALAQLGSAKP
jgi:CMP-2-keto-3-deoxyoctulosonic acid synthetase